MFHRTRSLLAALAAACLCASAPALAAAAENEAGETEAVLLVAKPALEHPLYGHAILLAKPVSNGMHVGFIINKPTRVTLGEAFPDHEPSRKVPDPLFLGGPVDPGTVFALVQRGESPGAGSVQLAPGLFVAIAGETVDRIIENDAANARFLFGSVIWRPGELEDEVSRGFWYVMKPETELVFDRNVAGLWERLVERSKRGGPTL